jgi:ATP-binding cassette, subfamily B, bacterial
LKPQSPHSPKSRSPYWLLLPYLRPHGTILGVALVCTVGFVLTMPMIAFLVGKIAQDVGQGNMTALLQLPGIAVVLFLIRGGFQFGQDSLMAKVALKIALDIRRRVYIHLQSLNVDAFDTTATGDLTYRLTEEIDRIGEVIHKLFHQFLPCVLQLLAMLSFMVYRNWQLTIATLIVAPLMGVLIGWFGDRLLKFSQHSQSQISELSALITEVISGIRLVKTFAAEDYEVARFLKTAEKNRQTKYATERIKAIQHPIVGFLEAMGIVLLFILGGWQIFQGNLTGAEFVSFAAAVVLIIDPINIITLNYNEFKQAEASVERVFQLLQKQPSIVEAATAIALPQVQGRVEYDNVYFSYPGQAPVLNGIELVVQPGEVVALVGLSGAGKTTLVNLFPRFYDPQQGRILIDGIDIQTVTLKSLRQQIGIVPQETTLFSGTIAQNIAYGQFEYDLQEVQNAAKVANAHNFISAFPDGYFTILGERGVNLSGGQRQRIAIARAVLLNPRILILDEATSALDSESEALVQEALERLMRDRTVFIIAHRLATVRRSDRILVLEKGQILESGTHESLIAQNSRYAKFYAQQFPA